MKLSEFMVGAKELIKDESSWTKDWFARNDSGLAVSSMHEDATCFCSLGAIERFAGCELGGDLVDGASSRTKEAQNLLESVMGGLLVEEYNDTHTHEEVMAKWGEAIEVAKAAESFQ